MNAPSDPRLRANFPGAEKSVLPQHWGASLHVNKGLAGAPAEAITAPETPVNPALLDPVALIISGAEGPPPYPGIAGHEPDLSATRQLGDAIEEAMNKCGSC